MNNTAYQLLLSIFFTICLLTSTNAAFAYGSNEVVNVQYNDGYHYRHHRDCQWIPAHWRHGKWHPAHKECYRRY
jgi:hypothetical protein